ncbi:MAG: hypothetical protein J6Q85_00870 [Clostridia bacterium]|nr:hypothetical protein [Clostridia bacterium]
MSEAQSEIREGAEASAKKASLRERLENFWYYYKWHTVVVALVIIFASVLIGQLINKRDYDINIVYAGGYYLSKTSSDGIPPYNTAIKSLERVVGDYNGDGEVNINLDDRYVLTAKEIDKELALGHSVNEARVKEDYTDLNNIVMTGDYHVMLLSRALYDDYCERYDGAIFLSLEKYVEAAGISPEYTDATKTGIYLKSLEFSKLPVIESLPEDTVLCLRCKSVDLTFGLGEADKKFENAEDVIRRIMAYK